MSEAHSSERRCACVSWNARDCYTTRYKLSTWDDCQDDDGECECRCHEEYRQHMQDENDALEDLARG